MNDLIEMLKLKGEIEKLITEEIKNITVKELVTLQESGILTEGKLNTLFGLAKKTKAGQAIGTALNTVKKNKALTATVVGGAGVGQVIGNKIGDKIRLHRAGGEDGKIRNPLIDCLAVGAKGSRSYNRCVKAAYAQKGSGDFKKKVDSIEDTVRSGNPIAVYQKKKADAIAAQIAEEKRKKRNEKLKHYGKLIAVNGLLNMVDGENTSSLYYESPPK